MSSKDTAMEVDTDVVQNRDEPGCSHQQQSSANIIKNLPIAGGSVMASSTTVPSVTVSLHPLVIMNISEHWTRIRAQEGCKQQGKEISDCVQW